MGFAWELLGCKGIRIRGGTRIIVYFVMYEMRPVFFLLVGRGGEKRTGMELFDDLEKLSDVVDVKVYFFGKLGRGEW